MITRENCVICKKKALKSFYVIPNFPAKIGVTGQNDSCPAMDMNWAECQNCGCVQLLHLVELEILYEKGHNSSFGKTWDRHHELFAEIIVKNIKKNNTFMLEIGGANLILANKLFQKTNLIANYQIIDLACGQYDTQIKDQRINFKCVKIDDYVPDQKFDLIVHSHTLEHFFEPSSTLLYLREMLSEEGMMIMSIPNISSQVEDDHLNSLHFEHTYFYDEKYLKYLLNSSGFKIQKIIPFSKWNNFYICMKSEISSQNYLKYSDKSKVAFTSMMQRLVEFSTKVSKEEGKIFSFGAHIFSQYLCSLGLREKIIGVLDNDENKNKKGCCLAGTDIPVYPVSYIKDVQSPTVILKVAQFYDEIVHQIFETNANSKVVI